MRSFLPHHLKISFCTSVGMALLCSISFIGSCQHTYDTLATHVLLKAESSCYLFSYFPYVGFEVEIPLGKNQSLTCNGGPIIGLAQPSIVNGETALNRTGFVLNPGIKKYILRSKPGNNQLFLSADFFYREASFRSSEKFVATSNLNVYEETIRIHHKTWGATLNIGQMLYFKNFGLEFSAGLGALFMRHLYSEKTFPEDAFENEKLPRFWRRDSFWTPRAPVRTRLFYRF